MTKTTQKKAGRKIVDAAPEHDDVTDRINGTVDQRQDAAQRAEACSHELDEVLRKHRCRIVPVLNPTMRMVGDGKEPASEGIVSCTYGVAPNT